MSCEVFPPKAFEKIENARRVGELLPYSPGLHQRDLRAAGKTPRFTQELANTCSPRAFRLKPSYLHQQAPRKKSAAFWTALKRLASQCARLAAAIRPEDAEPFSGDRFQQCRELIAPQSRAASA